MHLLIFFFSNHKFDENNEVVQKDKDRKDKKAKKKKKKDKKKNKGKVAYKHKTFSILWPNFDTLVFSNPVLGLLIAPIINFYTDFLTRCYKNFDFEA